MNAKIQGKNILLTETITASATITERRMVTIAGAHPSAGASALGVAEYSGVSGDLLAVNIHGIDRVEAGGAITAGGYVEVGTGGKVIAKDTGVVVGKAMDTASADGDFIRVLLIA